MRKHSGMRPQDIVVLLKITALGNKRWQLKDLAKTLYISPSEVSESLNRSSLANLIDYNKTRVQRQNLIEFLEHGLKYVFPPNIKPPAKGYPTAHAHPFMKEHFNSDSAYVWPDIQGNARGNVIELLYPNQIKAVKEDAILYKLLALTDVLRVGRTREIAIAGSELEKMILNEPSS